jgi:hypothetical protein
MSLTAEEILKADDLKRIKVSTPEWGGDGHVYVRVLTSEESESFGETSPSQTRVALLATCDDKGNAIFTPEQFAHLQKKSSTVIRRICEAALEVNELTEAAQEKLRKNSSSAQRGASRSP